MQGKSLLPTFDQRNDVKGQQPGRNYGTELSDHPSNAKVSRTHNRPECRVVTYFASIIWTSECIGKIGTAVSGAAASHPRLRRPLTNTSQCSPVCIANCRMLQVAGIILQPSLTKLRYFDALKPSSAT